MRAIILAAGQGTRLRPLTDDRPKCMVELEGKPLIQHQIETFRKFGIDDINVVAGYLESKVDFKDVKKLLNPRYDETNMVYTLFCAEDLLQGDDVIISYGDIVFNDRVLKAIVDAPSPVSVAVDLGWKEYWSARMDNPLDDAETLKIGPKGNITELGKKASSMDEIQGQYIGLIKITKDRLEAVRDFYHALDRSADYDGKDFDNMYMTTFLQMIADRLCPLAPATIQNGWMEIDEPSDLEFTRFLN